MNQLLSSLEVFYHKLQSYHWYVKGPSFFTVHAQLESYYDEIKEQIDEVAETLLMIGEKPVSTLSEFIEQSTIKEAKNEYVSPKEFLPVLLSDFEDLLHQAKSIKKEADEKENPLVSAVMDGLIASYSKSI